MRLSAAKRRLKDPQDLQHSYWLDIHSRLMGKAYSQEPVSSKTLYLHEKLPVGGFQSQAPISGILGRIRLITVSHWADAPHPGTSLECHEIRLRLSVIFKSHPQVVYVQNLKRNAFRRGHLVMDQSQYSTGPKWHHSWLRIEALTDQTWGKL